MGGSTKCLCALGLLRNASLCCSGDLAAGGIGRHRDAPKSHEHIIEHYGNLVASEPGYLGQSGKVISRARTDRMVADYGLIRGITKAEASETTGEARQFVDACRTKWNFKDKMTKEITG
jgi:uncharacterized protein (UPF0332 family)